MWSFLSRIFNLGPVPSRMPFYSIDESGIREIALVDKKHLWSDVLHVGIVTTEDGPFFDDVFFIIETNQGNICIPQAQAMKLDLLKNFERLPGFKWEQVIDAMTCATDASFACWDRSWPVDASAPL